MVFFLMGVRPRRTQLCAGAARLKEEEERGRRKEGGGVRAGGTEITRTLFAVLVIIGSLGRLSPSLF